MARFLVILHYSFTVTAAICSLSVIYMLLTLVLFINYEQDLK